MRREKQMAGGNGPRASRLLAALDALAMAETISLDSGRTGEARALHGRAAPLLAEFCRLAADPGIAASLQPRLAAWLGRRRRNRARVCELRARLLEEGERIAAARMRLERLAPAYRKGKPRSTRLSTAV